MHLSSAKHVSSCIITILKLDSKSPAWFADSFSKSRPPKSQGQRYHEVVVDVADVLAMKAAGPSSPGGAAP